MDAICQACQKNKSIFACVSCGCGVCKSCVEFVQREQFLLADPPPIEIREGTFCGRCFDEKVAAELTRYEETTERAKNVFVFYKDEHKITHYFDRGKIPVSVKDCEDKEDVLMKLAYKAASQDCNAMIETEVIGDKVRKGAYQTTNWSGSCYPISVDPRKLKK
jgi:hypothetical protein